MPEILPESRESRWFSRAAVTILLTALVLFTHYLNQSVHGKLVNLATLIVASVVIFGAGLFLERLTKPWPARALVTAGLAAFYSTAFAAFYFQHLRLIDQPLVGGAIVFAVALLIVWFAERREAPITILFAVILAGYTTALQPILFFTLFSDVVLVGAGSWFLARHGRVLLAFITLTASYATYAIWWFYDDGQPNIARYLQLAEFWQTCGFFAGCWGITVAGVFLTTREKLGRETRLALLSLNHALFFSLVVFLLPPMHAEWLSTFSIWFGAAMIAVGVLTRAREPSLWRPAFQQGLLVIALGLMTSMVGPHLVLVIVIVSSLLLVTGIAMSVPWSEILCFLAGIVALVATLFAVVPDSAREYGASGRTLGILTGLVLTCDAWGARHVGSSHSVLNWRALYFAVLGGALWLFTAVFQIPAIHQPPLLAMLALALTVSFAILQAPEFPFVAKGLILAAQILWLAQIGSFTRPWWNPLILVFVTLMLSRWWQTRGPNLISRWESKMVQTVAALAALSILFFWLEAGLSPRWWLFTASVVAVASLLYGIVVRDLPFAVLGQAFTFASVYEFCVLRSQNPHLPALLALVPVLMFLALAALLDGQGTRALFSFEWASTLYRGFAALAFIVWLFTYCPANYQFFFLEVCGFVLLLWTLVRNNAGVVFSSLAFSTAAVFVAWISEIGVHGFHLYDLITFALLLTQQQLSKRLLRRDFASPYLQNPAMTIGIVTLWRWVSLWSEHHFGPSSLTIAWSMLGLVVFAIGAILREPMYCLLGWSLIIIAALHVWIVDMQQVGALQTAIDLGIVGVAMLLTAFFPARSASRSILRGE